MTLRPFTRGIAAEGPAEAQTFQQIDNFTTYSFTRISAEGSPVSSRLSIPTLYDSHNGTEITLCGCELCIRIINYHCHIWQSDSGYALIIILLLLFLLLLLRNFLP